MNNSKTWKWAVVFVIGVAILVLAIALSNCGGRVDPVVSGTHAPTPTGTLDFIDVYKFSWLTRSKIVP